jgi:2-polyprenyl-3-methyl-5-hydroxy-6-metoxy-1,4-benzoquinol methylase
MTAPPPSQGRARDRAVDVLSTVRLARRLPFIEVLSVNSSIAQPTNRNARPGRVELWTPAGGRSRREPKIGAVSDCCTPRGYRQIFSEKRAQSEAKRYRKKGLDKTSKRIVDLLLDHGVEGRTVLEVGGGIGSIQIELLRAGASRAVSVELTPTYEEAASSLLREVGLADRVERKVVDFVEAGTEVEAADILVMNRVICCYPDMPRLAGAAASRTRGLLVMSFPKRRWWTRLVLAAANLGLRIANREFQVFLHPPDRIRRAAELHGLRAQAVRPGLFWEIAALERPPSR